MHCTVKRRVSRVALVAAAVSGLGCAAAGRAADVESDAVQKRAIGVYAQRYRVDETRARYAVELQDRAAGLDDDVARALGERYAGVWYDPDDRGRLKIGIARGDERQATAVLQLVAEHGLKDDADLVAVRYTEAELVATQDRVRSGVQSLVQRGHALTSYDPRRNSVVVRAPVRLTTDEEAMLRRATAVDGVEVRRYDVASLAGTYTSCGIRSCNPPFRGGRRILGMGACTSGFIARDNADPSKLWMLTAGHCILFDSYFGGGATWSATDESGNPPEVIGKQAFLSFATSAGFDTAIVSIRPAGFWGSPPPIPAVVVKDSDFGTTYDPTYAIRSTSRSSIGQVLCRSGQTTGTECGVVDALGADHSALGPDGLWYTTKNLGEIDVCGSEGGDSGGPLYKRHRAYGTLSGEVDGGPAFCWETYQGVRGAEGVMNVTLVLSP